MACMAPAQPVQQARVDAFLVPRADEHQGEYVPKCAERLAWLTGFTGSAGACGGDQGRWRRVCRRRYVVQAPRQVDTDGAFEVQLIPAARLDEWLADKLKAGAVVGYDPKLHTQAMVEDLGKALAAKGHQTQGAGPQSRRCSLGEGAPRAAQSPIVLIRSNTRAGRRKPRSRNCRPS